MVPGHCWPGIETNAKHARDAIARLKTIHKEGVA
jgi:hypothetical protein